MTSLTVIVPAFNSASTLARAIKSIDRLGVGDVEIIVVDDGSTDTTAEVCSNLAYEYQRLKLVRTEQLGVSHARNVGLDLACGDLIAFLDADDEFLGCGVPLSMASDVDLCRFAIEEINTQGEVIIRTEPPFSGGGTEYLELKIRERSLYVPCWAYIYRRSFLLKNGIRFKVGVVHEDLLFSIRVIGAARKIESRQAVLYRYIRNESSITLSFSSELLLHRIRSLSTILDEVIAIAREAGEAVLFFWAEQIIDYAWDIAIKRGGVKIQVLVFHMELKLLTCKRLDSRVNSILGGKWRLKRALLLLLLKN